MFSVENGAETREISSEVREMVVQSLAAELHDVVWKGDFREQHPEDTTRSKELNLVKDSAWAEKNELSEVDIFNTSFVDLPPSWQEENIAAAKVVVDEVVRVYIEGDFEALSSVFVDGTAVLVHNAWRQRRKDKGEWEYVPEDQQCDFEGMEIKEQDKDRHQVIRGIEFFKEKLGVE